MSEILSWFEDTEKFRAELEIGHHWELRVAYYLLCQGFVVQVPRLRFRKNLEELPEYRDQKDIWIGKDRFHLEVKSRNLEFTSVDDFPYDTALVDTVKGWEAKWPRPFAVVMVSQKTGERIIAPTTLQDHWQKKIRYDNYRGFEDEFYEAPKAALRNWIWLIEALRAYGE